jgi:hypothetical protein
MHNLLTTAEVERVDSFDKRGLIDWNRGLEIAAAAQSMRGLHFFLNKGATDLSPALFAAINGEKQAMVTFSLLKVILR